MTASLIAAQLLDDQPLHIASLVVHTRPETLSELSAWLLQRDGVEIHAQNEQGKLVVVMETDNEQNILDLIDEVAKQPGALNAALVYHEMISGSEAGPVIVNEEHNAL